MLMFINLFTIFKSKGKVPLSRNIVSFDEDLYQNLKKKESLSFYSANEATSFGFFHFMPLKVEDKLIGCLGMSKKVDNTFLTSEDWELLRTISSPVALALENAYLYNQASERALELGRLKDYSENIIESLTVGVAVLDQNGVVIGWNRVLEETFDQTKENVIDKNLIEILGRKNFRALQRR